MARREYIERPTGTKKVVDGVQFDCWAIGIGSTEYRSEIGRIRRNYNLTGWYAAPPNAQCLQSGAAGRNKVYREFETAARDLIKLSKGK